MAVLLGRKGITTFAVALGALSKISSSEGGTPSQAEESPLCCCQCKDREKHMHSGKLNINHSIFDLQNL